MTLMRGQLPSHFEHRSENAKQRDDAATVSSFLYLCTKIGRRSKRVHSSAFAQEGVYNYDDNDDDAIFDARKIEKRSFAAFARKAVHPKDISGARNERALKGEEERDR